MIKILFCDVDGVLNRCGLSGHGLEEDKLLLLQSIVEATGCKILLSDLASDYWRAILNEQDPSGEGLMGERVAQYQAQLPTTKP